MIHSAPSAPARSQFESHSGFAIAADAWLDTIQLNSCYDGASLSASRVLALWVNTPARTLRLRRSGFKGGLHMLEFLWITTLSLIVLAILYKILPLKHITIFEYQKGLKYNRGRCVAVLDPGQHWFITTFTTILPVDVRAEFLTIPGQDVLSSDGVTLKISLAAEFQIIDANIAINRNANFRTSLYLTLQMALREIVGREKIDVLIENRDGIGPKLLELTSPKSQALGLKLISADVKDIMFPGEMKKAFAQVIKAQKDGLAALERARGETAALRHLANAARSINDNPSLLQLRALQALGESSGNTLVFGVPGGAVPFSKPSGQSSNQPPSATSGNAPDE